MEKDRIKDILTIRIEKTRLMILDQLLKQKKPWVEHSIDLRKIIVNLTKSDQPQSMYEIERLFQSCRRGTEITNEAFELLKVTSTKQLVH